jgi:hypothetical protein
MKRTLYTSSPQGSLSDSAVRFFVRVHYETS